MPAIKILIESPCPSIRNIKDTPQMQNNNMTTSPKNPSSKPQLTSPESKTPVFFQNNQNRTD